MKVEVSILSVAPCLSHRAVESSGIHGYDLVPKRASIVGEVEVSIDYDTTIYEYIVIVKGTLDPGIYAVEIVGATWTNGTKIRCDDQIRWDLHAADEEVTWECTLRGPALDRFVARLVCLRRFPAKTTVEQL